MKEFTILIILFMANLAVGGQPLPLKIVDQPDGITIEYFNANEDSCLPQIFIGEALQILFPCYSKGNYDRVDIRAATVEINRIREFLTKDLISKLNQCCMDKYCPDTTNGYYLMIKAGENSYFNYLDKGDVYECGGEEMSEIIELLNLINENF